MNTIKVQAKGMLAISLLFLCALSAPSFALESIGKVIVSVGTVEAHDRQGVVRRLKRRSPVYDTDIIVTNDASKAQVRFSDGSMLALKPNSRFAIETYQYQEGDDDGKAVYNLLKGGMQTITGAIGRKNKENYALKTPTATIGIRGTYYQLKADGDGLIGGVKEGAITVTNKSGTFTIKAGQYFRMAGPDAPVVLLVKPPVGLGAAEGSGGKEKKGGEGGPKKEGDGNTGGGDGEGTSGGGDGEGTSGGGDGEGTSGGGGTPPPPPPPPGGLPPEGGEELAGTLQTIEGDAVGVDATPTGFDPQTGGAPNTEETDETPISIELVPAGTAQPSGGSYGLAFFGGGTTGPGNPNTDMFSAGGSHQVYFDQHSSGVSVPVFIDVKGNENCVHCQFSSGSALLVENGFNATSGLTWGRWRGDYIVIENGVFHSNLSSDFHYIYSPNVTNSAAIAGFSGTARFGYGGGTAPTDMNGSAGLVNADNSYIQINFDNLAFEAVNLDFTLAGSNYIVTNVAETPIDQSLKTTLSLTGSGLNGRMETQFVSQDASGISTSWGLGNGVDHYFGVSAFGRNSSLGIDVNGGSITTNGTLFTSYLDETNTALAEHFRLGGTNTVYTNEASAPTYIEYENGVSCSLCQFGSGKATLFDAALNTTIGTSWGRWSGAYVIGFDGFEQNNIDRNYHFIYNSFVTNESVINGFSGGATFYFVGGSSPTDQLGNVGSVIADKSFIEVDFDAQSFDVVSLGLSFTGNDYLLVNSSSTAIESSLLTSIALSGDGLVGELLAQFSGVDGEGVSGLYNFSGGGGVIQGVGLFQRADQLVLNPVGALVNSGSLATTYINGTSSVSEHLTLDAASSVYMNTAPAPTYVQSQGAAGCIHCQFEVGAATLQDTASNVTTGTSWGRWQGAYIIGRDGFIQNNLGDNYHFIYNPNVTTTAIVDGFSGVATFDFFDGTAPTDQLGNIGAVNAANSFVQVDFDTQSFDLAYLDFTLEGNNYFLKNTAPTAIDSSLLTSIPLAGDGLTGDLLTQFSGANGSGLSGLYNLSGGGSVVQGVGLFQRLEKLSVNPVGSLAASGGSLMTSYLSNNNPLRAQFTFDSSRYGYVDASQALTYVEKVNVDGCVTCQFDIGTASVLDNSSHAETGVSWGRWDGGYVVAKDGFTQTNLSNNFHYLYNPNVSAASVINEFSSTATFSFVGGSSPTDQLGNVGSINAANSFIAADFDSQQFTSAQLDFLIGGNNYVVNSSGAMTISSGLITPIALSGSGLNGDILTQFSGASGYGLSGLYELSGGGNQFSGSALFVRSAPVAPVERVVLNPVDPLANSGYSLAIAYFEQAADGSLVIHSDLFETNAANLVYVDELDHPTFINVGDSTLDCNNCQFSRETAALVDDYADDAVWGRWNGSFKAVNDGALMNVVSDFSYVYKSGAPVATSGEIINRTTMGAQFDISGGPGPVDSNGNVGTWDNNSYIMVDFGAGQQITNVNLEMDINETRYQLNNSGAVSINPSTVTLVPVSGNGFSGEMKAQFISNGIDPVPSEVGADGINTSFEASDGATSIGGAAVFDEFFGGA